MWTRFVFILLMLLAPAAAHATPACCADELPAQGCSPQNDCPTDADGECAVTELAHPPAATLLDTSFSAPARLDGPILRAPDATFGAPDRHATGAHRTPPAPLYLRLQSLRN